MQMFFPGICAVLLVFTQTLQGCVNGLYGTNELEEVQFTQLGTKMVALTKDGILGQCFAALATDPLDTGASSCVAENLAVAVGGEIVDWGATASVLLTGGKLSVSFTMAPIRLFGLITLQRDENDTAQGPIFSIQLPVQGAELALSALTPDLLSSSAHIEGYMDVPSLKGYFKLLINQKGYRFFLEFGEMRVGPLFTGRGALGITQGNNVRVMGEMRSSFTIGLGLKVSQMIQKLVQPAIDQIAKAQAAFATLQAECTSSWCQAGLKLAQNKLTLAREASGPAAWIVSNSATDLTDIFTLHSAKFDFTPAPDVGAIQMALNATVLGKSFTKTWGINMDDLENAALELANSVIDL
jgi:hypothetical protein